MAATLYSLKQSHPSRAAHAMLELKRIEHRVVDLLPGFHPPVLRLRGFPGITVPALKIDGRKVQGSLEISRALEELEPEPPLFPPDGDARRRVEEAERWGEAELQPVPRRMFRWGLTRNLELRRWLGESADMPAPGLGARTSGPMTRWFARQSGADDAAVRRDLEELPGKIDHVERLLEDGVTGPDQRNAATYQVLSTVRALDEWDDLRAFMDGRPAASAAREVFPAFPGPVPPFLPQEWLAGLSKAA